MKTTLIMATTLNGYVAGVDDDTDWVKNIDALYKMTVDFGVAIMGRRTYEECDKYNAFPYKGALNIVMTHDKTLLNSKTSDDVIFTHASPREVLQLIERKDIHHALVIGGGHINGSFLKERLIDEIIFDIHPMVMAKGIHVFESDFPYQQLKLVGHKQMDNQILRVRYEVTK